VTFFASSETIEIEPVVGWKGGAVHCERMTLVTYVIAEGAPEVHEHHHPEEEARTVIEGQLAAWVDGDERLLEPERMQQLTPDVALAVKPGLVPGRRLGIDKSPPSRA
jgi:quercetin dioxygenase-like cupin family protein